MPLVNGKRTFIRRLIQAAFLLMFLFLLVRAVYPPVWTPWPVDTFLRLDPLAALLAHLPNREFITRLWPGLLIVVLTVIFGRFFCGYICPCGSTLDLAHHLSVRLFPPAKKKTPLKLQDARKIKYLLLTAMAASALAGVNTFFWGSPLALITRFYTILVHPLALLGGEAALSALEALGQTAGIEVGYHSLTPRRYDGIWYVLIFFMALFQLERVSSRFWCRNICPAGAALAALSTRPLWRRRVSACLDCGRCSTLCPMGAVKSDPKQTACRECLNCGACADVCPVQGISFKPSNSPTLSRPLKDAEARPSRRAFLGAAGAGLVLSSIQHSRLGSLLSTAGARGNPLPENLVRPPGARPEPDFLARCLRCGLCMKACPTNALQPTGLAAGLEGIHTPILVARRGPCEPECRLCGQVCPTGAIAPLSPEAKQWAKIGQAVVLKHLCLAWAEGRSCMVCHETCPYGAVKMVSTPEAEVTAPVVEAARCYGCGYCENHCPAAVAAIVVKPLNALRLNHPDYKKEALALGFNLDPHGEAEYVHELPEGQLPPGFLK